MRFNIESTCGDDRNISLAKGEMVKEPPVGSSLGAYEIEINTLEELCELTKRLRKVGGIYGVILSINGFVHYEPEHIGNQSMTITLYDGYLE